MKMIVLLTYTTIGMNIKKCDEEKKANTKEYTVTLFQLHKTLEK